MGNYKSRPQSSCSEELRKKISEFHITIKKKLDNDLKCPLPNEMRQANCTRIIRKFQKLEYAFELFTDFSEFQEACALGQSDRISTFANQECINEYMPNQGLYPCHLCCQIQSPVS